MSLEYQTHKVTIRDPDLRDDVTVVCELIKDNRWKAQLRTGLPDLDTAKTFDSFSDDLKAWAGRALRLGANGRQAVASRQAHLRRLRAGIDAPLDAQEPTP